MTSGSDGRERKALVLLSGGGHLFETLLLVRKMTGRFSFDYVVVGLGGPSSFDELPEGQVFHVASLSNFTRSSRLADAVTVGRVLLRYLFILRRSKPDLVVGVGTNNVLPLFLAASLLGKKRIFVESITRVTTPSQTARILGRLGITDRLYVQWPELVGTVRGAAYKGSVL